MRGSLRWLGAAAGLLGLCCAAAAVTPELSVKKRRQAPIVTVLPHTLALNGVAARGTLQGHVREPGVGPVAGAFWNWTVRTVGVVAAIPSSRSAVTVVPLANGTTYIVGAVGSRKDSSLVTVTGIAAGGFACTGINVTVGQNLQALVTANGPGTTFCIRAGTHAQQSVLAKNRDTFRCEPGAIFDGQMTAAFAFYEVGGNPDSLTINGCEVTNYLAGAQRGAINAGVDQNEFTLRWTIDSSNIHHNNNLGLRIGSFMKVRWTKIHHNQKLGIGGVGDSVLIYKDSITDNNYLHQGALGDEAGGSKFVFTNDIIIRKSFFMNNYGPGMWWDICNKRYLADSNTVEGNLQEGVVTEVSYGGRIVFNTIRFNGLQDTRRFAWPWGAGIGIHASGGDSSGIDVSGNLLTGNAHGIAMIQQPRADGNYGNPSQCTATFVSWNVNVHNNTVIWGPGTLTFSAAVTDAGNNAFFTSRNNTFENNTYNGVSSAPAAAWAWMNAWRTTAEWIGFGNDTPLGTFNP